MTGYVVTFEYKDREYPYTQHMFIDGIFLCEEKAREYLKDQETRRHGNVEFSYFLTKEFINL